MRVLGIETSCDETAVSIIDHSGVRSDVIWSQSIHQEYGGVVPELASRAHVERVVSCTKKAFEVANVSSVDGVAATAGPGLMGAVLVGFCFAKSYALARSLPFVGVNHLEGHLLSPLLERPSTTFPFLSLVVSGGHTTIYLAKSLGDYEILGQTIDDAAGEAYDKVARLMGLGYPGGPIVDGLAQKGDPKAIQFPRPRPGSAHGKSRVPSAQRRPLDMSFSGLKTAVRNYLEVTPGWLAEDVSASFQAAVSDVLLDRVKQAVEMTGVSVVAIGGGVAANSEIRKRITDLNVLSIVPPRQRCTDNGSMIAHVGRLRLMAGQNDGYGQKARSKWRPGDA